MYIVRITRTAMGESVDQEFDCEGLEELRQKINGWLGQVREGQGGISVELKKLEEGQ